MKTAEEIAREIGKEWNPYITHVKLEQLITAAIENERKERERTEFMLEQCRESAKALFPEIDRLKIDNELLKQKLEQAEKLIAKCLETLTDGEQSEPYPYLPTINECRKFLDEFRKGLL